MPRSLRPLPLLLPLVAAVLALGAVAVAEAEVAGAAARAAGALAPWLAPVAMVAGLAALVAVGLAFGLLDRPRIAGPPRLSPLALAASAFAAASSSGLLLWAAAEPLRHLRAPPFEAWPGSDEAAVSALAASMIHAALALPVMAGVWMIGFSACGNAGYRPSAGAALAGGRAASRGLGVLDGLALTAAALVAMAGAAAVLSLTGEALEGAGLGLGEDAILGAGAALVALAALTGGRPRLFAPLALASTGTLLALCAAALVLGPTGAIVGGTLQALWTALWGGWKVLGFAGGEWSLAWTLSHWIGAAVLGLPVGLFLSRLARGYRLGEALALCVAAPALLSALVAAVVGGLTLEAERAGGGVGAAVAALGDRGAVLAAFASLPFAQALGWLAVLALGLAFASFGAALAGAGSVLAAPGDAESDPDVATARQGALLVWAGLIALGGLVAAMVGGGAALEALGRLGAVLGLPLTVAMAASVALRCLAPSRMEPAPEREPIQIDLALDRGGIRPLDAAEDEDDERTTRRRA